MRRVSRGKFISLEGGEGAGKSTQAGRLVERLRARGLEVVRTREPGGSPGAEAVRELVVNGPVDRWSSRTEALLMYAARSDHLERTILPALESGRWVVCDRFADSTRAYQAEAGEMVEALDRAIVGDNQPDLTLIFDMAVKDGLARAGARGVAEARFEAKGEAFHQRLREAFRSIAERHPERCVLIDASGDADAVEARVWTAVERRLL